jgi:hypothetical protein
MPRRYVLLTPADGALYRLAVAVERQEATEPIDFPTLARLLTEVEAGEAEVNIAQMSEILADLRSLLAGDPKAVLEVLAGKVAEA